MKSWRRVLTFVRKNGIRVLPVLGLVCLYAYWGVVTAGTDATYGSYDPEFDYFVASLSPFKGQTYAYVDHPGTPVEMLGTLFLALTMPFVGGGRAGLIDYHLRNPQLFFGIAHTFMLLANLAGALYCYVTARTTGRIGALPSLALALMFYGVSRLSLGKVMYWSHVAFIFPFGTPYLFALFRLVRRSRGELSWRAIVGLGVCAGLLTAVILYAAAWVVGALTTILVFYRLMGVPWVRTIRAMGALLLSAWAAFFLAILPMWPKWPQFLDWVLRLLLHQGRFGNGAPGVFSPSAAFGSLSALVVDLPDLFACAACPLDGPGYHRCLLAPFHSRQSRGVVLRRRSVRAGSRSLGCYLKIAFYSLHAVRGSRPSRCGSGSPDPAWTSQATAEGLGAAVFRRCLLEAWLWRFLHTSRRSPRIRPGWNTIRRALPVPCGASQKKCSMPLPLSPRFSGATGCSTTAVRFSMATTTPGASLTLSWAASARIST